MAKSVVALLALLVGQASSFAPITRRPLPRSRLTMAAVGEDGNAAPLNLRKVQLDIPRDLAAKRRHREEEAVREYTMDEDGNVIATQTPDEIDQLKAQEMVQNIQQRTNGPSERMLEITENLGGKKGILIGTIGVAFTAYTAVQFTKKTVSGYKKKQAELVKDYAFEMIRDDGNQKLLTTIHKEYIKKLGPGSKKEDLFKEYLRTFFAKKTLSGAMVRSLQFAIELNGAKDEQVVEAFLELSEEASKKPIMRGKILFLAERIIKDPAAMAKLEPVRESIIETFESAEGMQIAQDFLAETALKTFCGKKANDLTAAVKEGKLLGMDEERSTAIYNEVKSPGFVSESDYYYKVPNEQAEDPAAALKKKMEEEGTDVSDIDSFDLDKDEDGAGSSDVGPAKAGSGGSLIAECGKCGYTMFIAKGREDKFFPPSYKCPTCDCGKEEFTTRTS